MQQCKSISNNDDCTCAASRCAPAPTHQAHHLSTTTLPLLQGLSSGHTHVALGGEGCNLRVYDLAAAKDSFLAKGNKPNAIGLVDKPYITAITYTGSDTVMAGERQHG